MSCIICGKWGCTDHVGDKGLRYEVRFKNGKGMEHTLGWTDDPTGGGFVEMIEKHPVWHSPRVWDRKDPAPVVATPTGTLDPKDDAKGRN